jgi:hypothetical protein
MAHANLPTACPDCGQDLHLIQLFARGQENPVTGGAVDSPLGFYAEVGATPRGDFGHTVQEKGTIRACKCQSCHRIFLYGVPLGERGAQHVRLDKPLVKPGEMPGA